LFGIATVCFRDLQTASLKRKRVEQKKSSKEMKSSKKSKVSTKDTIKKPLTSYMLYCQAKREKVSLLSLQ